MPKVQTIMISPVLTISGEAPVFEAARTMGERHVGSLIVFEHSQPVGIITERDLLSNVIAKQLDMKQISVREVMNSPLVTVDGDTPLEDAIALMVERKITRLPVKRNGEIVGIVTSREIFDFLSFFLHSLK
jgi:CBS domain-containing protein